MTRLEVAVRLAAGALADPNIDTDGVGIGPIFDLADKLLAEGRRREAATDPHVAAVEKLAKLVERTIPLLETMKLPRETLGGSWGPPRELIDELRAALKAVR